MTAKQILLSLVLVTGIGYTSFVSFTTYREIKNTQSNFQNTSDISDITIELFQNKITELIEENKELTSQEKLKIAKVLTGAFERHTTINKIQEAKKQLELEGKKITNRAIAKMIQMDVSTVGKRIKDEPVDMDYEVSLWN